jgi:hypothetical protein
MPIGNYTTEFSPEPHIGNYTTKELPSEPHNGNYNNRTLT